MSDHFCANGGYLVSADEWLPDAPYDYHWPARGPIIGCNRLRCRECGQAVAATRTAHGRSYECRCLTHEVLSWASVSDPLDPISERVLPWACSGHPPLTLPATVDGAALSHTTDWSALVRHLATAPTAGPPGSDKLRGFAVHRLYNLLEPPASRAIADAVASLLDDRDPALRAFALIFFEGNPDAPGGDRLTALMRDRPQLFVGVRDPGSNSFSLWDWLLEAIAWRIRRDGSGRVPDPAALDEVKRRASVAPGVGRCLFVLGEQEPDWLLQHVDGVVSADPGAWKRLLNALSAQSPDRLADAAQRVRNHGAAREAEILDFARNQLSPAAQEQIAAVFRAA